MKNVKLNENDCEDCIEMNEQNNKQQSWTELSMQMTKLRVRLDGVIQEPYYYRNILDRIEMLSENDEVELVLDTVGGNLDGCIAICDAIQSSEALVTAILVNRAYSAGSAIALCCDNIEVRPNARMMLHSFSGGWSGKDHELELDYMFNKKFIRDFLKRCYENFLTEEELSEMYNGKDWWMNYEQIVERLKKRVELNQAKLKEEQGEGCDGCVSATGDCEGCDGCNSFTCADGDSDTYEEELLEEEIQKKSKKSKK